ncbi:MAG: hypothetical protein K8E24_015350 [Methanobacterium paludis]|jgi:hypothetical protein|nr:hypothetical protein [Methanobacterium paludis]
MKRSQIQMEFCGKPRYFKNCPNRFLTVANKKITSIQRKMQKEMDRIDDLRLDLDDLILQAEQFKDIEKNRKLTPEEKEKGMKLLNQIPKKQKELKRERDKVVDKSDKFEEELDQALAEKCTMLFEDFTVKDFDDADPIDKVYAKQVEILYNMYMSGFTESEIEQQKRDILKADNDSMMNNLFPATG